MLILLHQSELWNLLSLTHNVKKIVLVACPVSNEEFGTATASELSHVSYNGALFG